MFSGARAQGDLVAQISDAPGQFEFGQRYPHRAPKPPPPWPAVERDGEGPSIVMIRSRAASASSAGRVRGVDCGSPRRALVHPACCLIGWRPTTFAPMFDRRSCRHARANEERPVGVPCNEFARPARDELTWPQPRAGCAGARSYFSLPEWLFVGRPIIMAQPVSATFATSIATRRRVRLILNWGSQECRNHGTRVGGSPLPVRSQGNPMKPWLSLQPSRLISRATPAP